MKRFVRILSAVLATVLCFSSISVVASVDGENITNKADFAEFEELSCTVTANVITISGKAPMQTSVVVWMQEDGTSNPLVFRQFNTDASGRFSKSYIMNPDFYAEDGANDASVKVSGKGLDTFLITGIELYGRNELNAPIEDFVGISNEAEFYAFFENADYMALLGIEETYTAEELSVLYGYYGDLTLNGDETLQQLINIISGLVNKLDKYKFLVESVSNAAISGDTDEIGSLLTSVTYADIMFSLDHSNILRENEMWARMATEDGYTTLEEIENAYIAAREAQLEEEKETGGAATTDRPKNFKSEWKLSSVANLITISGTHEDEKVTNVVFHISGMDSGVTETPADTIGAMQVQTNSKGEFTAEIPLNTSRFDSDVTAVFRISAPDTNIHQFYIPLYSQDAVDEMIEEFKNIGNVDDLKTFIETYSEMLQLSGNYTDEKYETMYALYDEKAENFESFTNAMDVLKAISGLASTTSEVLRFIDAINIAAKSGQWGKIQSTISDDYKALKEKSLTYAELLKETEDTDDITSLKGLYKRMLNKTYSTIQDVIGEFKKAHEEQYKEEQTTTKPTGGGGSGGSGGGFGGNTGNVFFGEEYFEEEEITVPESEELPAQPFSDLKGYDWAKSAIDNLRKNNIVNGDGDGTYRPGATMTREEYLSVLLKTYGIKIKSGSAPFSDVAPDAWYCDVVATAYEMGITNGIGGGKFGIGQNISRADMVVLASRLAHSLEINIPQVEVAVIFEDYAEIPDYAYEAVVEFQQANFINGDTNGYFNPADNTTRAEAAVFFWNIYDYIN